MVLLAVAAAAPHDLHYRLAKKVILGGGGGWDYFDVDPETGHVFVPRGSHVLVVDAQLTKLADIKNVGGAHAIALAPEQKKAFLSTEASVSVLNLPAGFSLSYHTHLSFSSRRHSAASFLTSGTVTALPICLYC